MNKEKQTVLDMLAQGRINTDEAARLLENLEETDGGNFRSADRDERHHLRNKGKGKKLRVQVKGYNEEGKKMNVNVGVPLALARYVDKLIASCLPEVANRELIKQGINLRDLNISQLADTLEDIDEDIVNADINQDKMDLKVRVYVE